MGLSDGEAWEKDFGENKDVVLVNVADIVNEKTGKTWREENLEKEQSHSCHMGAKKENRSTLS